MAPLLDAFFEGLGSKAVEVLSANLDRAGARLVRLVEQEQRRYMAKPTYHEVVELREFNPPRATDRKISGDRFGAFLKSAAYEGWQRSLFSLEWFDSRPERTVANMLDAADNMPAGFGFTQESCRSCGTQLARNKTLTSSPSRPTKRIGS